jgi:hypothetical protein
VWIFNINFRNEVFSTNPTPGLLFESVLQIWRLLHGGTYTRTVDSPLLVVVIVTPFLNQLDKQFIFGDLKIQELKKQVLFPKLSSPGYVEYKSFV